MTPFAAFIFSPVSWTLIHRKVPDFSPHWTSRVTGWGRSALRLEIPWVMDNAPFVLPRTTSWKISPLMKNISTLLIYSNTELRIQIQWRVKAGPRILQSRKVLMALCFAITSSLYADLLISYWLYMYVLEGFMVHLNHFCETTHL